MSDEIKKDEQVPENQKPSEELTEQDLNNVTGGNIVQNIVGDALVGGKQPSTAVPGETVSLPYGTTEWTYSQQKT
jgi:bacteriocin-like protein